MDTNYGGNPPNRQAEEGLAVGKTRMNRFYAGILAASMMAAGTVLAQEQAPEAAVGQTPAVAYRPKFPGDPARSESEAQALGFMRVVLRAQREYKKRHDKFADSLEALAGTGSFTKRMAHTTDRGDYTASFRSHKDGFVLTMTPKQLDAVHRSFYAEDDGAIHGDDQKPADLDSPKVK
jgi:hypothetical protein